MQPLTSVARRSGATCFLLLLLSACAMPTPGTRAAVYDFGPGALNASPSRSAARPTALVLEMVEANPALDSTAMLYRLAYSDSQQLRPYSLARWSMTPTQLLGQRLREALGQRHNLLRPGDETLLVAAPTRERPLTLRIELEEFSQLFTAPDSSVGLLRLRATVSQTGATGAPSIAQRSIAVQRPAPSADAPGGVRALNAATDAALQEVDQWLQELGRL
jgi:cholesterol transport system auxiliary component